MNLIPMGVHGHSCGSVFSYLAKALPIQPNLNVI